MKKRLFGLTVLLYLWTNLAFGQLFPEEPSHFLIQHTTPVFALAFSPNGQILASASPDGIRL